MADKGHKKKRKSNGHTDGNDADIYGKAAAEAAVCLAVTSSIGVTRLNEIVEVAKEAIGVLQTMRRTTEITDCSDRLVDALTAVGEEALHQWGVLSTRLAEVKPLLASSGAPEAAACCKRIEAMAKRSGERPPKPKSE